MSTFLRPYHSLKISPDSILGVTIALLTNRNIQKTSFDVCLRTNASPTKVNDLDFFCKHLIVNRFIGSCSGLLCEPRFIALDGPRFSL